MIELLVRVVVGRLEKHLLRLLGQLVLLVQLDAILNQFYITLLLTQFARLDGLLFGLFRGLEIHLCLQISRGVAAADTFGLS